MIFLPYFGTCFEARSQDSSQFVSTNGNDNVVWNNRRVELNAHQVLVSSDVTCLFNDEKSTMQFH